MSAANGTDPAGYRAVIHLALTKPNVIIVGIPRELMGILLVFCLGIGMLANSYGAIFVYIALHALFAAFTWRDPYWPQVWSEAIKYRLRILSRWGRDRLRRDS